MLRVGISNTKTISVTEDNTAVSVGSGTLPVFATPAMCALMEATSAQCVENLLDADCTTVGTRLEISHISATPVGMEVHCESRLESIDGRKLVFRVTAYDAKGIIGEGTHERCIINISKFVDRVNQKNAE